MMLEPPANSDTSIDDAERALRSALQNCAAASIEDARVALQARDDLRARCNRAKDVLANVAPKGIADLQAACAALEADAASAGEPGDIADLTAQLRRADAALAECDGALAAAVSLARQAQADLARAEANVASAENAVAAAVLPDGDRDALARGVDTAEAQVRETREAVDSLKAQAPDVGAAEAALQRARSVQDRTEKERNATVKALAELNGEISARASRGVEEALADVAGRAKAAAARAARFEGEVAALTLLRDTLLAARSTARDAYFEPVRRTLMPLLAMVYDQAELVMDDATLLPSGLRRGGQDERMDILSGGTREQIAILTRLAFAALLNEAGQPVPVILDDALVHSDDDRIAAMFNALHRSASAQQIIVLTCRQRAFRDLGGAEAQVRISDQRDVP